MIDIMKAKDLFYLFCITIFLSGCANNKKDERITYLEKQIFSIKDYENFFQWRIGNPNKAKIVFVYYTSPNCPDCIEFHKKIYPKFKTMEEFSNNICAFVGRDYPYNIISLKITAIMHAVPRLTTILRKEFFEVLGKYEVFKDNEDKIIGIMKDIALSKTNNDDEKKAINDAVTNQELNQRIFDCRVKDKEILKIDSIPTAYVLIKKNNETIIHEIQAPANENLIMDIIKKNK